MRIALVTPRYWPAIGGVETHVEELAAGLVVRGHEVEVLTQAHDSSLPIEEDHAGVPIRRFAAAINAEHYRFSPGLLRFLAGHAGSWDVLHAHNYHALPALAAAFTRRGTFILTPHYHGESQSRFRDILHRPYRTAGALMMRRASRVISVSPSEASLLKDHFPAARSKIAIVPNGVDAAGIAAAQPFETGDARVVLVAGRLADYKRVDATIQALAHLDTRYVLRVSGEGPMRSMLEALARKLGVTERVSFLGRIERDELNRWFSTADVFVTMSEIEAMGITVLEALAGGARVVASDIPAHRDARVLGGERVRLIRRGASSAELAAAIEEAAASDAPARPVPTWQEVVERTLAVYDEAIAASSTKAE